MLFDKLCFRTWLREKFQLEIKANPHDRAFLESEPWLKQFVPFGRSVKGYKKNGITVERVDFNLLQNAHGDAEIYLVNEMNEVVAKVQEWLPGPYCTWKEAEPVYKAFLRLGEMQNWVTKIVVCEHDGSPHTTITIHKFPNGVTPSTFVADAIKKLSVTNARKRFEDERKIESEYNKGIEYVQIYRQDNF